MVFCAAGLCRSAPGEVGIGGSSPVDESSPLRLRLGDDLLSSLLTGVWVGVARPRRLLRRLGVDAGDDMVLWYLRHKDKLALNRPNTRLRVSWKRVHQGKSGN